MKKFIPLLFLGSSFIYADIYDSVKLEGLTQISHKIAMERLIFLKDSQQIDNNKLNTAIKDFYDFGYFNDIEVYEEDKKLIFKFTEKPFIVNIEMDGYKTRAEDLDMLLSTMRLKKGTMYTKEKLEIAKKILLEELQKEGFINSVVEIETTDINKQSVAIKFNVNKGDEVLIKKINYIGAKELNENDFADFIANREEDLISWWFGNSDGVMQFTQLEYDHHRIKDVYLQHGFLDAKVKPAFSKIDFNANSAEVEYVIDEGDQYETSDIIIYTDESIVPLKELKENLKQKLNKPFNIANLRKDIEHIKTKIADKGYAFVEVNYDIKKDKKTKTAQVIFNVVPGQKVYINDVIISGNSRTLDRIIRRDVYLAPKDLFTLTDYRDSKSKLSRTGYFESVDIKQEKISDTLVDIVINVKEAPTGSLIVGGGYGSYDGFMVNASVNDKNIFGSGMDLGFSIEHSDKKDIGKISLNNPSINDSIYNGNFSIYRQSSVVTSTSLDTNTSGDQTTDLTGFSMGIGRALGRHTRIGVIYSIEDTKVSYDLNSSANTAYLTSAITPYVSYNTTDDYYVPRSGITAGDSLKYAGIGGDAKYTQNTAYLKAFYGLQDLIEYDWILRYKTTVKNLIDNGNIPDGTTFYLGGPTSVRGYESYAFQPEDGTEPYKHYWTNTFEISFPLIPKAKMRWAIFYDHGMVGRNSFNEIKKSGYGVSINWYSPVGPLQFIFANALNPDPTDKTSSFEFSLGTSF